MAQLGDVRTRLREAKQLVEAGRLDEAAVHIQPVLMAAPDNPEANYLLGSVLAKRKKFPQATEHMERAATAMPDNPAILDGLGALYDAQRRYDDAIAVYDKLLTRMPQGPKAVQAVLRRGVALAKSNRHEEAADAFRKTVKLAPGYAAGWHNLGNVLVKLENREAAVEAFLKAAEIDPENPFILYGLGRALLWLERYTESIDYLTRALVRAPYELQIISYKILALRHAGMDEAANELEGIDDMILSVAVPHPPEFASLEEWNEALKDEIVNHPALTKEFENRATRNGAKVDHIFAENKTPLFELFERQVRVSFEETLKRMPKKQGHPLPLSVSKGYFADMWANVMYDQGHQVPHNHPKGWFSATYYNVLPDRVTASGDAHEGWIEFGGSAYDFPEPEDPPKRQIQPEPGLMVVFPSYLFHRTIPFSSEQIRISCAFDAKPHGWRHS